MRALGGADDPVLPAVSLRAEGGSASVLAAVRLSRAGHVLMPVAMVFLTPREDAEAETVRVGG